MRPDGPITLEAPAKLNLRLRILGRRPDGFHEVETHLVKLRLADSIELRPGGDGIRIDVDGPIGVQTGVQTGVRTAVQTGVQTGVAAGVPTDESNLCCRAARAWFDAVGRPPALGIRLTKRIPVAAGLGGGSSDAAAVLVGLNGAPGPHLPGDLPGEDLLHLAAGLGSDVPFFVSGAGAALAVGRGERLRPLAPPRPRPVLIVVPNFGISAAEAYGWWSEDARSPGAPARVEVVPDIPAEPTPADRIPAADHTPGADRIPAADHTPGANRIPAADLAPAAEDASADWDVLTPGAINDLAGPVERRRPALGAARRALALAGAAPAILCGSGACVAGVFRTEADRDAAGADLSREGVLDAGWRTISTWTVGPAG